jgi:V/A-type H+/Na+-transporting ATPase subunit G/H
MDDTLQRLLEAEMRAEKIAQQAEAEQERTIQKAMADAKSENDRFTARIPDLHRGFIAKAEERAEQNVAELRRRYDERHVQLRDQAERREARPGCRLPGPDRPRSLRDECIPSPARRSDQLTRGSFMTIIAEHAYLNTRVSVMATQLFEPSGIAALSRLPLAPWRSASA